MSNSPNYHDFGPPSLHEQSDNHYNLGMLYCGFFVVTTAGLILAIYHCIAVNWCTDYPSSWLRNAETATSSNHGFNAAKLKAVELESSLFKYNTKGVDQEEQECAVCLSVFEQGEDVRKLVRCNHCFHAPCIDMWLYSHFDCPLCRAPLGGGDDESKSDGHGDGGVALSSQSNSGARYSDSGVLPV